MPSKTPAFMDAADWSPYTLPRRRKPTSEWVVLPYFIAIIVCILAVAAWVTHIGATIIAAQWVLLVVGAFFFPVGVIHGVIIWLGVV